MQERNKKTETIKIKKSWFYSAGTKWGWGSDGLDKRGVGINKDALVNNDRLIVEVDRVKYSLDCKQAVEFIRQYKSFYDTPGGTRIGVVSKELLEELNTL